MDFQDFSPKTLGVGGCKGNQFPFAFPHNHNKVTFHISIKLCINQKFHCNCYKQILGPLSTCPDLSVSPQSLYHHSSEEDEEMEEGNPQRQPVWDKDDGEAGTTWQQKGLQKEQEKKTSKSSTSAILRPFLRERLLWLTGRGACCCQTSHCRGSSSAETKETLILPLSSSAPPFNSLCLFTASLPSLNSTALFHKSLFP